MNGLLAGKAAGQPQLSWQSKLVSGMLVLAVAASTQLAYGQGAAGPAPGTQEQPAASPTAGSASGAGTAALKGGVQKVDVSLEHLRDVGLDLKRVMTAARHLYDEVTIQPVRMITEPEVVGMGMIINIPIGTQPVGPPEPPRKDRVDLSMSEMTPVITMFKKNADEFVAGSRELDLPSDALSEMQPMIKDWIAQVNDLSARLSALEPLTKGPNYDNQGIASLCSGIQQDAKKLDTTRRKVYKFIRKEEKRRNKPEDGSGAPGGGGY